MKPFKIYVILCFIVCILISISTNPIYPPENAKVIINLETKVYYPDTFWGYEHMRDDYVTLENEVYRSQDIDKAIKILETKSKKFDSVITPKILRTTIKNADNNGYKKDKHLKFYQDGRCLLTYLLEKIKILPPIPSQWDKDGNWIVK